MSSTILRVREVPEATKATREGDSQAPAAADSPLGHPAAASAPQAAAPTDDKNPFLLSLGERVRSLRSRRGMTRKALAAAADVSERHLANLEYGVGNASILVLLQVAQALQCSLAELLGDVTTRSPEWLLIREMLEQRDEATLRRVRVAIGELLGTGGAHGEGASTRSSRVALIGLRGAGKSTLGAMLADDLALSVHRAQPRDREVRRLQHQRDPGALRAERLPPLRAPRARRGDPDLPRGGDRDAGRNGVRCGDLQPAARALHDGVAAGRVPRTT